MSEDLGVAILEIESRNRLYNNHFIKPGRFKARIVMNERGVLTVNYRDRPEQAAHCRILDTKLEASFLAGHFAS